MHKHRVTEHKWEVLVQWYHNVIGHSGIFKQALHRRGALISSFGSRKRALSFIYNNKESAMKAVTKLKNLDVDFSFTIKLRKFSVSYTEKY